MLVASFSTVYAIIRADPTRGVDDGKAPRAAAGNADPSAVNIHSFVAA
jgi:hypothetical protein